MVRPLRIACAGVLAALLSTLGPGVRAQGQGEDPGAPRREWLKAFSAPIDGIRRRGAGMGGLPLLGKFRDDMWVTYGTPGQGSAEYLPTHPDVRTRHPTVRVPPYFVTDLASIPRFFWVSLPRDGAYARAAIIHDWLYWSQQYPRDLADEIFRYAMIDDNVNPSVRDIIYWAARERGQEAWEDNRRRKSVGEERVLKKLPSDPAMTWQEWKNHPEAYGRDVAAQGSGPDRPASEQ